MKNDTSGPSERADTQAQLIAALRAIKRDCVEVLAGREKNSLELIHAIRFACERAISKSESI